MFIKGWHKAAWSLVALFATSGVYAAAHEQGAAGEAAAAQGSGGIVEELVTTARRNEESVLEVPLSIATLNANDIESAQIVSLEDVANQVPGFSFQNYFGQNLSVPTIRGVSQVDIFGDPNAPIYIDGIYVSSKSGINFSFLDVERIEVLRGPQPAYFGYNAFSGAVNFTDEKRRVAASASGPLVDGILGARIAALYDEFGGTYDNANPSLDQDIGGFKYKTVSGSLFFTPTDNFDAVWNIYVSDDHIDPPALDSVTANCEPELDDPTDPTSANPDRLLNFCGNIPTVGKRDLATTPLETGETRKVFRSSLILNWDVGFGTFSSLTGLSSTKGEIWASADRGVAGTTIAYYSTEPSFIPGLNNIKSFQAPFIQWSAGESELDDFSQELRFSSPEENRLRFTVGGYYRETDDKTPIPTESLWAPDTSLPSDLATFDFGFPGSPTFPDFCPCVNILGAPAPTPGVSLGSSSFGWFIFGNYFNATPPMLDYFNNSQTELWAGFFGVEYDFTDQLTAYVEGRYTDYKEEFETGNLATPVDQRRTEFTDDFFNWRASLEYHPNDLSTIYGSVATGVKQGGREDFTPETVDPDPDCPGPNCVDNVLQTSTYGSEEILTYELGYKTALADGRTFIDTAIYYSDWDDIVLPQIIDMVGGKDIVPTGISQNVGKASILGGEFALTSQITDNFRGGLGVSYSKAELDRGEIESFVAFPSFAPNGDMSGQTLQRQPEAQFNANATYQAQFRGDWEWYTRGDLNYQSRWYVGLPNQARVPGRWRANARVGLQSDRYTVELWVRNLFDDNTVDSAFRDVYLANATREGLSNFSTLFPWRLTVGHPQRRTAGLTLRARF